MKKERKPLSRLSNEVLFLMIVNRLWIEYDHGGISVRRSYQATLLEGLMPLFPSTERHYGISGDIYKEARSRIDRFINAKKSGSKFNRKNKSSCIQLELPFTELETFSNIEFALLSLEEMCRWYKEEAERLGFYYQFPGKVAILLKGLLEMCYSKEIRRRLDLSQINKDIIIKQGDWRCSYKMRQEGRMEDFKNSGINPWRDQMYNNHRPQA